MLTGQFLRRIEDYTAEPMMIAFSTDSRLIVSASAEIKHCECGRLPPVELLHTLIGHTGYVTGCAFSPSGQYIVSASVN